MTTNKYQMWLTANGEREKLQFPVLPETIKTDKGSKNQSVSIAGLGEITVIQSRPAIKFSFSCFFPSTDFPGISVGYIPIPHTAVGKITEWKESKKPVHFIITGCNVDLYCTIEDFQTHEDGGDVGTIYYSIALKEYREITVRQVKVEIRTQKASVRAAPARVDNTSPPRTYTVRRGDCLWNIAQRFLGSGSRYPEIKALNGLSSNMIYAGQVFKLPS
ncbi:MAG: LysM peptidoglycan-binding domain-containing protein [Oscillospiraceae bacterium]